MRRMPGSVVPRRPSDEDPATDGRNPQLSGAPFDPAQRPLGMVHETWAPSCAFIWVAVVIAVPLIVYLVVLAAQR